MTPAAAGCLAEIEHGTTATAAFACFDALAPVAIDTMIGAWRGRGLATGHPFDGLLEGLGWHGKRFDGPEDAHPLVFDDGKGDVFSINPSLLPLRAALRHARFLARPMVARLGRKGLAVTKTSRPQARLRMTEYRGVSTATMIYDSYPINDVFRIVDRDTLLGVMDMRFTEAPFFFVLHRESGHRS